jgi:hypothetical protein
MPANTRRSIDQQDNEMEELRIAEWIDYFERRLVVI